MSSEAAASAASSQPSSASDPRRSSCPVSASATSNSLSSSNASPSVLPKASANSSCSSSSSSSAAPASRPSSSSRRGGAKSASISSASSASASSAQPDPSKAVDSFLPSMTELKEELKCPVCLRLPRDPPVYQCERGHMLCKDCHPKCGRMCPTCRKPLGKIRSLLADKVLTWIPVLCKHSERGCEVEASREEIEAHEDKCEFRLVSCVDIACGQAIPFHKMLEHMYKGHETEDFVHANGSTYESYFIVNSDDFTREIMWISDHLVLEGCHFFRECYRHNDGHWYVWVYLLGTQEDANRYYCTIKIKSYDDIDEIVYTGRINPLTSSDRRLENVLWSLWGLCFPDYIAKRFWTNNKIYYYVEVFRRPDDRPEAIPVEIFADDLSSPGPTGSDNSRKAKKPGGMRVSSNHQKAAAAAAANQQPGGGGKTTPGGGGADGGGCSGAAGGAEDVRETSC